MYMDINFLWIGEKLGKLEQLTLKSFIDHDHQPVLWLYDLNCKNIPQGTKIEDARQILPENKIFSYTGHGDCRKGSYGGYSDIFRYYLLQKVNGWYCDMDVTCLHNFSDLDQQEYVFRPHKNAKAVGNILKAPGDSIFLKKCIEKTEQLIDSNNDKWVLPVQILGNTIVEEGLEEYIAPKEWFGEDSMAEVKKLIMPGVFLDSKILPKYAVHWCHEAISTGRWDWTVRRNFDTPLPTTLYYNLLKKHKLL